MHSFKLLITIAVASNLASCGGLQDRIRRTKPHDLPNLLVMGRKVAQPPIFRETPSFGLVSPSQVGIFQLIRGHDEGVPALMQFDTQVSPTTTLEDATNFAQNWLRKHGMELGLKSEELRPADPFTQHLTDNIYVINFERLSNGLPVRDANVEINFAIQEDKSLRLREVINRSHGVIRLENPDAIKLSDEQIAKALAATSMTPKKSREIILPIDSDTGVLMVRATEVSAWDEQENVEATLTFMNGTSDLIEGFRHLYYAKVTAEASVIDRSYIDGVMTTLPLPFAKIDASSITTDAIGAFESNLNDGSEVTFSLAGTRTVTSMGGAGPVSIKGIYSSKDQRVILKTDNNSIVGVNAYYSINRINAFARRHVTKSEISLLERPIPVRTNAGGSCNANYTGSNINLFGAGNNCANTALINDIAYHEWGHGLDDSAGGIRDGAFSEGIGDILAGFYTNKSDMGSGFFQGKPDGIRSLDNDKAYPANRGEVHREGLTIGGAFWRMRKALIDRHGTLRGAFIAERLFFRHLLVTPGYTQSYQNLIKLDDDDANPATPSPNKCLITETFAKHGLATLEPNCQDPPSALAATKISTDIALTILNSAEAGVNLAAAGPEAARTMFACIGPELECLKNKRKDLEFNLDGTKEKKVIFTAKKPSTFTEAQYLTVFALDKDNNEIGKRAFYISQR